MPHPTLKIHPVAEEEFAEARDWYAARSDDAAKRFLMELDRALGHVVAEPLLAPLYLHQTRGFLLRRYPYVLVYDTNASSVRVFALAHGSRRPGYWHDRQFEIGEA